MTKFTFLIKRSSDTATGFTIIEILIVLAIAGLILVIVFLAIPYLEILQRNTARKQDASRLVAEINTLLSSNGYVLPGMKGGTQNETAWASNDCPTIAANVGHLAEFGTDGNITGMCTANDTQATTNNDFVMYQLNTTNQRLGLGHNYETNWLVYITGAVCPTASETILNIPKGDAKQSILIYPWENLDGPVDLNCLQVT